MKKLVFLLLLVIPMLGHAESNEEIIARAARNAEVEREWAVQHARDEADAKKARENMAREDAKEEAAKKRKCGKDYMALRIGMTLDRIEKCYEEPAYVTETVGKNGVVETYRGTFYFIHVKNGQVVGYTRRTN